MNFRLTAALFGLVFVLGAILLILSLTGEKKVVAEVLAQELAVAGVKTPDVDAIEFERPDAGTLLIVRTGTKDQNTWQIQKPITAGADAAKILPVIDALLKAKPTPHSELSTNPAVHGLDPPSLKVTLRAGDKSSTVNLGHAPLAGDKGVVYVTTSSQSKRPMAVRRSALDVLFRDTNGAGDAGSLAKWTADYRTPAVFPSDSRAAGEDVETVKLEMPNKKKELALTRLLGGAWKFDSPAGWGDADSEGDAAGPPGTFTGVRRLLGALTSMSAATPGDFIDQPKDLKEYGLDAGNPDLVKVVLTTREKQTATVYVGKREGAAPPPPAMHPGMPPMGGKVYVRVEGQAGVIRATAGDLTGLNGVILDPNPLRDRTLVNADRAKVDGLDIVLAGQPADKPTKLRRAGPLKQWTLYGGPGDPQPTFGAPVEKLLDVVLAKRSVKDFPAPNPANFAAVTATVYVWSDGFNPAPDEKGEPVKKAEPVKIEFGRKDGDAVYVRRTRPGLPANEFTIPAQVNVGGGAPPADAVAAVALTRLDLLDRSLPSFSDSSPARIAVTGVNNYTLARDAKPDPATKELLWRFDPADPRKGQVADAGAVSDLIGLLGTSQSAFGRFVEEDPKPEKLTEYGLTPPRLKVVVGFVADASGAGEKERGFEFGKDTADPDKVYARVIGGKTVFTLQRRAFDRFWNPDLRDRVVFRGVDAPAVNKVELKGWGDAGFVTELEFEKNKDGIWAATKAPPGYAADPAKVAAFVELLTRARVKSFEKGVPDAKHGFGDPKQNLAVTLRWPGGAVATNLGATPDNGATYYGWSAWLPQSDPVFTIDGAAFKPFKDKPGGFAK